MGTFDYAHVSDPRFVCSEGHDLSGQEFQTKDFECVLGDVIIKDFAVTFRGAGLGLPHEGPFSGRFELAASCPLCPCFVQEGTGNIVDVSCLFTVDAWANWVTSVRREGETTAEFLRDTPGKSWMVGCHGPMSKDEAEVLRREIWAKRRSAG